MDYSSEICTQGWGLIPGRFPAKLEGDEVHTSGSVTTDPEVCLVTPPLLLLH